MNVKKTALLTFFLCLVLLLVYRAPGVAGVPVTDDIPLTPTPDEELPRLQDQPNHLAGQLLDERLVGPNWRLPQAAPILPVRPQRPSGQPFLAADVAAGNTHTCALSTAGGVKCWGDNYLGQLGDGTAKNHDLPVDVAGLTSGVTAISSLHKHTCALTAAGGVKCWGYNYHGELGDGTTTNRLVPVDVVGLSSGVLQVAAGGFHTCALMADGSVKCWGANWHGQVGDGTNNTRLAPVDVVDLSAVAVAIVAGKFHTCALTDVGGVRCWGYNRHGEVGNGTTNDRRYPTHVVGLQSGVAAVHAGGLHTCALLLTGQVKCWGDNLEGQLGDGTTTQALSPVDVVGLAGAVAAVEPGGFHTCALLVGGGVQCWGDNWAGQVGDGANVDRLTPVTVNGLPGAVAGLAAGDSHTCAVIGDGSLRCWGSNSLGQLGDGTSGLRLAPAPVAGLSTPAGGIDAGGLHTCALTAGGSVQCWGNNKYGQLGDDTNTDRLSPVIVSGLASGVQAVAVGGFHSCALTTSGGVQCWGDNSKGQLGDGTTDQRNHAVDVVGLTSGVRAIALGIEHSCALTEVGGVKCWGSNWAGQLGNGTNNQRATPVDVDGLTYGVAAIAAGASHTCAVKTDGVVKCWGYNLHGQLGNGNNLNRWSPVAVGGLDNGALAVTAGEAHTCALIPGNMVVCWGGNYAGQLGDGTLNERWSPGGVVGLGNDVVAVEAGSYHTCALLSGGAVRCWGDNGTGQLGDGTTAMRLVAEGVAGLGAPGLDVAAGALHTCALLNDGSARCWGAHGNGQVGDGTLPWVTAPNFVIGLNQAQVQVNYPDGAPGSYFTISGTFFPPDRQAMVVLNNHIFTQTIATGPQGAFSFLFDTTQAGEGDYYVTVDETVQASAKFTLAQGLPTRPQEGSGLILMVPGNIAYTRRLLFPIFP